jgi:hypothetical protein
VNHPFLHRVVRKSSIDPGKQVEVKWGTQKFADTSFAEHFSVLDEKAKLVAKFADGTLAGYEHGCEKGSAILLGAFVGQSNEAKPVAMHPRNPGDMGGGSDGAGTEGSDIGRTAGDGRRERAFRVFL